MKTNYGKRRKSYSRVTTNSSSKHAAPAQNKKSLKDYIFTETAIEKLDNMKLDDDFKNNNAKESNIEVEKINTVAHSSKTTVVKNVTTKPRTRKRKSKSGIIKKIFLTLLCLSILAVVGVVVFFSPYISKAVSSYEKGFDTSRINVETVPHVYDKDGNLISILYGYYDPDENGYVPTYSSSYVNLNSLPKYVGDAFTAIEDETFYNNIGVSYNRLLYAVFNYVIKGDSSFGGSTITQQLVKVATGDDSHSASRKAREIGSAMYLTDNWSKEKILASYMNLVYYGNGAYGIFEASYTYFNTEPKNLNIAQSAVLAALPNAPEALNPYTDEAAKTRLMNRQKLVLKKMLELNLITKDQYQEALDFNIEFTNGSSQLPKNDPAISQYLNVAFSEVITMVKQKYNCSDSEAMDKILDSNTKIYLNMNTNLQKKVHQIAINNYTDLGDFEIGGAMTDKSGKVVAIIGSRTNSKIDHSYGMLRQTGSSIKPLSVYGPAFDIGILNPNSYVYDGPTSIKLDNGKYWNVQNASRTYRGQLTARDAIAFSLNTVSANTLSQVGLDKSLEYIKSFGITSMDNEKYYSSLAVGGMTTGISPYEMTQAYNVFNNDGVFRSISTVDKIVIGGETITKDRNEHQVISVDANNKIKDALSAVANYGTGKAANLGYAQTYLKTGTTNDVKDIWTCGFTDEVTLALWGGYDTPKQISGIYNVNKAWKEMVDAYYNYK